MGYQVTLQDAIDYDLPDLIGATPTDARFLRTLNEACQRLLYAGKWWGCTQRYKFCAIDGCVTLPRGIATIEAVAVCGRPVPIWFQFIENGVGPIQFPGTAGTVTGCCTAAGLFCGVPGAFYKGHYPGFGDIIPTGNPKRLLLVCDLVQDVGTEILVLGYDENLNWIRTSQGGTIQDGELVALSQTPGTLTVNEFSSVTSIQVPSGLNAGWWMYEWDTVLNTQRMIGQYDYDDLRPSFSRWRLPILPQPSSSTCAQTLVDCMVKLDFQKVTNPTDYLLPPHLGALKEMMMAINSAEKEPSGTNRAQIIMAGQTIAMQALDQQLDHFLGSGRRLTMNVVGSATDGTEVACLL